MHVSQFGDSSLQSRAGASVGSALVPMAVPVAETCGWVRKRTRMVSVLVAWFWSHPQEAEGSRGFHQHSPCLQSHGSLHCFQICNSADYGFEH